MLLTIKRPEAILSMPLPHVAVGPGISKPHGASRFNAVFLCAKSQFISMLGWAGSRKTGRVVCPLCQPVQLDSMIGIVLLGLLPTHTEAIMPKFNAQEPINTLNLSVSSTKKQSLQKQVEIIGHALNIFCFDSSITNKDSLKKDTLELVRMLDDLLTQKKQSRFNIFAPGTKKVIADSLTYDQTMQYRDPKKYVIKFVHMVGSAS